MLNIFILKFYTFIYSVANQQLRGNTDAEKAQVVQWLSFADSEILPPSCTWVFPCLGIMQYNKVVSSCRIA